MKILIVDDIATNRKLLRVTLEAEGHTTVEAADGVEALQILARERVDAVISDILMPNMDGFRLCHEIRKSERLHALPFIIYTSTCTSPGDIKLTQAVDADKYLTKPALTETVLEAAAGSDGHAGCASGAIRAGHHPARFEHTANGRAEGAG
jgi:CheY-like chemotaxis protein